MFKRRSKKPTRGPQPMDQGLMFGQVTNHRHLACPLYGLCLDLAANRSWPSFTCRACNLWREPSYPMGPAQVLALRPPRQAAIQP